MPSNQLRHRHPLMDGPMRCRDHTSLSYMSCSIDPIHIAMDHDSLWISFQYGHLPFEHLWVPQIIVVEKCYIFSPSCFGTRVSCPCLTCICLLNHYYLVLVFVKDCQGSILGAIIHTNNFIVLIGLGEYALQRFTNILLSVINWNDYTDRRHHRFPCRNVSTFVVTQNHLFLEQAKGYVKALEKSTSRVLS